MKRIIPVFLGLCLLLCGCMPFTMPWELGQPPVTESFAELTEPTIEPTTEPTTEPITEPTEPQRIFGTITNSVLNVRTEPGGKDELIETLHQGERLEILEMAYYDVYLWGRIEQGWVSLSYVSLDNPDVVLLSQVGLQKGMVLEDDLKIYDGPNAQYPSNSKYWKDTRVEITGVYGKWGRTEKGWVDMEGIYIDGTEGPNNPLICKVASDDVCLRTDPNNSAQVIRLCGKGEEMVVLHQAVVSGVMWGCTSEGWICMDHLEACMDPAIVGDWYYAVGPTDTGEFSVSTFKFREDGTYQWMHYFYMPASPSYTLDSSTDSQEHEYGTFTFDGKTLTRKYTDWYYNEITNVNNVTVKNDTMTVKDGGTTQKFKRGDIDAAVKALDKEHYDSAIYTTWYTTRYGSSADKVEIVERKYNKDKTFTVTEYEYSISSNSYRKLSTTTGNFFYNGKSLVEGAKSTYNQKIYSATIKSGVLKMEEDWNYVSYKKGSFNDALEEVRDSVENSLRLNYEDITLSKGDSWDLYDNDAAVSASLITWISDDHSIATVENGVVTAIDSGVTYVRAILKNQEVVCVVRVVE